MNQTKKHLFLFTIGPVQSFIAQARKTQDLYAGSALLSDLINFALSYTKAHQHEIIFPYYNENTIYFNIEKNEKSYPNRFIALLNTDNPEKVKAFGQCLENQVRSKLEDVAAKKFDKFIPAQYRPLGLYEQVKDFLEVYWTAIPFDENEAKNDDKYYANKFKELEQYLGAVKNVRSFRQLSETGRKCSVNGEYNVKVYRKTEEEEKQSREKIRRSKLFADDNYIINGEYKSIKYRHVQPGEGLCAISFLKRLYKDKENENEEQNFPSTAKIVLLNLWNDDEVKKLKLIENYKKVIGENFDDELLFEDNLNETYFEKNGIDVKKLPNVIEQQRVIFAKAKKIKPSKYYALLSFDGDSMGEWLSKAKSKKEHQDFSELLINFAEKATEIVNKNGKTVYAGGDDFLGFVNLQSLFQTIECLKAVFDAEVTKKVEIENGGKEFTISMGVVIAHYKMPLGIVIRRVKEAEKAAKNSRDEKNSLAIDFITHSGSNRLGIIPFGENGDNLKKVEHIFNALKENFSDKWIRNFSEEFYLFPNKENEMKLDDEFKPLVEAELKRLILRAYKSSETDKKAAAVTLKNNAYELLQATDFNYANFTEMLYITSALVSKTS